MIQLSYRLFLVWFQTEFESLLFHFKENIAQLCIEIIISLRHYVHQQCSPRSEWLWLTRWEELTNGNFPYAACTVKSTLGWSGGRPSLSPVPPLPSSPPPPPPPNPLEGRTTQATPHLATVTGTCKFPDEQHTTHKSRWIRTTGQKYGGELWTLKCRTDSAITTYRRFVEAETAYLSICKLKHDLCSNTSSITTFHIMDSGTPPWETSSVLLKTIGDHLEKI